MVVLVLTQKIVSNIVVVHPLETKSVPKRQLASYIVAITVDFMEVPMKICTLRGVGAPAAPGEE